VRHQADEFRKWFDTHGSDLASSGGRVVLIVLIALVTRALLHRAVKRMIASAVGGSVPVVLRPLRERTRGTVFEPTGLLSERRRQRAETLGSVLRSIASVTVMSIAGIMVLSELGLDLTPVVASAGIIGVAVGFGAQNLVKDFLTGMFMLLEDQYGVGDVIDAGLATGTVEAVTLRTTRLRDQDGTVWHIRNGEIDRVGNKSQGWARALLDVPLELQADIPGARALALQVAGDLRADPAFADKILGDPEVAGLESVAPDGLLLRMTMRTVPLEQAAVERELRERLLRALADRGPARSGRTDDGAPNEADA